jgi:hypothetical protein
MTTIQLHIRIDESTAEWLRFRAFHERKSQTAVVSSILKAVRAASESGSTAMKVP